MKTLSTFFCLLFAVSTEANDIKVEGLEGGHVSFQCSHKLAWNYNKYFCKDPCADRDILATVAPGRQAKSDRIALEDSGNGVFRVNFSQLQLTDSRKYYCAVERPLKDTYTAVHLTVKAAVGKETTVRLDTSPTWTEQTVTNSTQPPTEVNNVTSTNVSTATDFTSRPEQDSTSMIVLCATAGAVLTLAVLILAACIRKCRRISKPQPAVCSIGMNASNALETEDDCDYDDIGEVTECSEKKVPGSNFAVVTQQPRTGPPARVHRAADRSAPLQLYENVSFYQRAAASSGAPAAHQCDTTLRLYINPLQCDKSESVNDVSSSKRRSPVTCKHTKGCRSNASARLSTPQVDEVMPKSLWFGLDLSGLNS